MTSELAQNLILLQHISAIIFFGLLAYNSFFLFTKSSDVMTDKKKKRNIIYRVCGIGCESRGCDFSACNTAEQKLAAIEAFENKCNADVAAETKAKAEAEAANAELTEMSMASIAAQLEYQNMMTLEDVEEV